MKDLKLTNEIIILMKDVLFKKMSDIFKNKINTTSSNISEILRSILFMSPYKIKTELIPMIRNLTDGKDYSKLITMLDFIYIQKNEFEENEENNPDTALFTVLEILNDSKKGKHNVSWNLIDCDNELKEVRIEAYHIDLEEWELLKLYSNDSVNNSSGYTFNFIIEPEVETLKIPYCNSPEISSINTIAGNKINSNCDTWGTYYGVKAQELYAFYIMDIDKYAIVESSYYEM